MTHLPKYRELSRLEMIDPSSPVGRVAPFRKFSGKLTSDIGYNRDTMSSFSNSKLFLKRVKRIFTHKILGQYKWYKSKYAPPSPYLIKINILIANALPKSPWIETGTYLGETTKVLSKKFPFVFTFEPSLTHFHYVKNRFRHSQKITVINSPSETGLEQLLNNLSGKLNIYLDGHYSGDNTFQGTRLTPIREELKIIQKYLDRFSKIFVAIDDFRVFGSQDGNYPSKFSLVEFCERNSLEWKVEHDIFMFKKN